MKIVIETESIEEARQVLEGKSATILDNTWRKALDDVIAERNQLKQEVAEYQGILASVGVSPYSQSKIVEGMKINLNIAKERDRYKAALEDIAHGPIATWNAKHNIDDVIRIFMQTAEEALHPKPGEE